MMKTYLHPDKNMQQSELLIALLAGTFIPKHYPGRIMKASFIVQPYPNKSTVKELALQTRLTEKQVILWFTHERCKSRKGKYRRTLSRGELICWKCQHYDYILVHMY